MSSERTVILRVDQEDGKSITYTAATSFSAAEIDEASTVIFDELTDTDDGWNEDKVLKLLEERGYIRIIGPAPEVIDVMF